MRAVRLSGTDVQYHADYEPEDSQEGLIPVDVLVAGICETDMQLRKGYMGFAGTLGHEFVGVARSGRKEGRRVVGEINCACGSCQTCAAGHPRHCPKRTVIGILKHDGAFADTVFVPEDNLHAVPDHVSTDQAVFTEPVAAACRILEQTNVRPEDDVLVLGDGRLGNLCAQVLSAHGCRLKVVGKHEWKLDRLRAIDIQTVRLAEFEPSKSASLVVDCTGSPDGFELALQSVSPCGTVVLKTTVADTQSLHLAPIVIDEVQILGSRCGPFAPALEMIADRRVQVESLISARFPLEQAGEAFTAAERPDTLKVLFDVAGK